MSKNNKYVLLVGFFLWSLVARSIALAQDNSNLTEVDILEKEFNKKTPGVQQPDIHKSKISPSAPSPSSNNLTNSNSSSDTADTPNKVQAESSNSGNSEDRRQVKKSSSISENLEELAPFSDISVLQLKYLPKTYRFQFYTGLGAVMNDPWYNNYGLNLKFAFHFTENWGLELTYMPLTGGEKQTAKDLYSNHGVTAKSFVTVKSYTGADIFWSPIYGKMASSQNKIVPFDMYFAAGGGTSKIDNGEGGSTVHISTGQIFAMSKSMAFRWDFGWHTYNATPVGKQQQSFSSLVLSAGISFFFPGAKYR